MGSNVNQIAQKVNAGAFTSYNFQEVVDQLGALHEALCRLTREQPMATVMYIPEKKQSLGAMKGVMGYVCQEKKTRDPVTGQRFVTGVHCLGDNACQEFLATKRTYGKTKGMNFYQLRAILLPKGGGDIGEEPTPSLWSLPKKLGRASRCWWPLTGTPGTSIPTLW